MGRGCCSVRPTENTIVFEVRVFYLVFLWTFNLDFETYKKEERRKTLRILTFPHQIPS